jgi:hypothetical protein
MAITFTTTPIGVDIRTAQIDGQVPDTKFFPETTLICGKENATAWLRYSDDDYETWSAFLPLHMWLAAPRVRRLGAGYRRAFELRHMEETAFRSEGFDLLVEKGVQ